LEGTMEIRAVDGKLSLGSLFGPVALGYLLGAGMIFVDRVLSLSCRRRSLRKALPVDRKFSLAMVVMAPFILIMQSVMLSGLIMLGPSIYRKWGKLDVVSVRETPID